MILIVGLLMLCTISAFATENNNGSTAFTTGDVIGPMLSMEEQLEKLSEEQKEIALQKFQEIGEEDEIIPYSTTWVYLSGFTMYEQEEDYCVVACTKSAMQYLTGNSDTQDNIADEIGYVEGSGASIQNALTYLNENQNENVYIFKEYTVSEYTMKLNFYHAITVYDAPVLFAAHILPELGWEYFSPAHCMSITGAREDRLYFQVADPYRSIAVPGAGRLFEQYAPVIYDAIELRCNGYIY